MSTSSCLTSVKAPGGGVSCNGKGIGGLGVEGAEVSSRGGIAVGFFAFFAGLGFAFDLPFPFADDVLGVGTGDLLGV